MPLLQGHPSPSLRTRTCTFQRIRLALYVFPGMFSIRERSCVELLVTVSTEDECLSVASGHHLLPQSFSFGDIFQLPYVMHLERSLRGFAVFTLSPERCRQRKSSVATDDGHSQQKDTRPLSKL